MNQTKSFVAFPLYMNVIDTHFNSHTTPEIYIPLCMKENKHGFHGFKFSQWANHIVPLGAQDKENN